MSFGKHVTITTGAFSFGLKNRYVLSLYKMFHNVFTKIPQKCNNVMQWRIFNKALEVFCCRQYENPIWLDELKQVYRQGRVCENCFIIILCCILCRKQLPPCSHFGFALLSPRRCSHKISEEALKYQDLPTATHFDGCFVLYKN